MTRTTSTRFGKLGRRLGTPVYSDGWWFCVCADVEIEGTPQASEPLAEYVGNTGPAALLPLLQRGREACWVRAGLPVGLQCILESSYTADTLIRIGLFAARVEPSGADVTYPFLCADERGRAVLLFSNRGPDPATRRQFGRAFWMRLLNAGDCLTDFDALVVDPVAGERCRYSCHGGDLSYEPEAR